MRLRAGSRALCTIVLCLLVSTVSTVGMQAGAQASALPSAQSAPVQDKAGRGRQLLDQMVQALGGQAWLTLDTERVEERLGTFYKGAPTTRQGSSEDYIRYAPFGERVVIVSKQGVFIPTTKRDVAEVWTTENGYEISYHGRKELPRLDVEDFERRRLHSVDTVMRDWLKRPGTLITYEGSGMDERRLADRVSVLTLDNDAVTLTLDQTTHLPRSRSFEWRNSVYKDFDTDLERYDDWQNEGGIMTALTITRYHNGDMASQRFLTKVQYHLPMAADLFDPDRPLTKK